MTTYMSFFLLIVLVVFYPVLSWASIVEVLQPLEQGHLPMQLRGKARETAFAQIVFKEALGLFPASTDECQQVKLREYLQTHAQQYVTGYQEISVIQESEFLRLTLDVEVNKDSLRELLHNCGAAFTTQRPLAFDLRLISSLTAAESKVLEDLTIMGRLVRTNGVLPEIILERESGTLWKGTIRSASTQISEQAPDLVALWLTLWGHYFTNQPPASWVKVLQVSGWSSLDGVFEFDRVLRSVTEIEDVQMLEMELLPSSLSATWQITVLDFMALDALLNEYLPSRGLTQALTGD